MRYSWFAAASSDVLSALVMPCTFSHRQILPACVDELKLLLSKLTPSHRKDKSPPGKEAPRKDSKQQFKRPYSTVRRPVRKQQNAERTSGEVRLDGSSPRQQSVSKSRSQSPVSQGSASTSKGTGTKSKKQSTGTDNVTGRSAAVKESRTRKQEPRKPFTTKRAGDYRPSRK